MTTDDTPITAAATRRDIPAEAAAILLELAAAKQQAELNLAIAGNMARAMCGAPADWELRAEGSSVFFAAPQPARPAAPIATLTAANDDNRGA